MSCPWISNRNEKLKIMQEYPGYRVSQYNTILDCRVFANSRECDAEAVRCQRTTRAKRNAIIGTLKDMLKSGHVNRMEQKVRIV